MGPKAVDENSLWVKEHGVEGLWVKNLLGKKFVGEKYMLEKSVGESTHGLGGTRGRVISR